MPWRSLKNHLPSNMPKDTNTIIADLNAAADSFAKKSEAGLARLQKEIADLANSLNSAVVQDMKDINNGIAEINAAAAKLG